MSKLCGRHHTLFLYSFMDGPERDALYLMCTHLLDSVDSAARRVRQRASFYVVAKSPIARLVAWARERGWDHLQLLSTDGDQDEKVSDNCSSSRSPPLGYRRRTE